MQEAPIQEVQAEENEICVSYQTQSEASLYGLATGLLDLGGVPNKKQMKKVAKTLAKRVRRAIGEDGARELLSQNQGAVRAAIAGIRKDPSLNDVQRKLIIQRMREDLLDSYNIGLKNVYQND